MDSSRFLWEGEDIPDSFFGAWLYAEKDDNWFTYKDEDDLPEEIKAKGFARVGFVDSTELYNLGNYIEINGNIFELKTIDVVDFTTHQKEHKSSTEGYLVCQPISMQSFKSKKSERESLTQSTSSPQSGESTNQEKTTTTGA